MMFPSPNINRLFRCSAWPRFGISKPNDKPWDWRRRSFNALIANSLLSISVMKSCCAQYAFLLLSPAPRRLGTGLRHTATKTLPRRTPVKSAVSDSVHNGRASTDSIRCLSRLPRNTLRRCRKSSQEMSLMMCFSTRYMAYGQWS